MNYLSVSQMAKKWNMSERGVRKYCAEDKIPGAFLTGKTWNIPENAEKPKRKNKKSNEHQTLLERLKSEKASYISGGIYHKIQIELTYNSNHIEGSKLTHDQTRYIFETIHPFQDGNGRVGRLIMFKECLKNNIVPFIIDEDLKMFYYRGLSEWNNEKGYLTDTCLAAQDKFKKYLDYFKIPYIGNTK